MRFGERPSVERLFVPEESRLLFTKGESLILGAEYEHSGGMVDDFA